MPQSSAPTLNRTAFNQTLKKHWADPIFLIDEKGRITFANSQAQAVFGFNSAAVLGKHLRQAIGCQFPHTQPHLNRQRSAKGAGETGPGASLLKNGFSQKDGLFVHDLCAEASLKVEGRPMGAVLVIRDVTEQKWAEQARQETQLRLNGLLDAAMDGIVAFDSEQRIITCNASAEKLFGYKAGELLGKPLKTLLPQGLPRVLRQPRPSGSLDLVRGLRSGQEELLLEASISEVAVRGRKVFHLILRDISERKRVEQALAESHDRLRQVQKMAAIGQLAGGVAHDFNNLLTIISGHAELLLAGLSPEAPMRDSLAQICGATSRAASLTRQLLAFSRKQPSEPRIVELNRLIRETQQMFRRVLGKEIVLDTLLSPQLSRVKIDPSQMDQVILNLVVNARDAMTGGGRLTIQTLNVELNESSLQRHSGIRPGSYVALVVRDTGCGMNAEVKAQIFEPFFTTKAAGKGTGLGLAVVQDIVKRAGGHISVHSEPGIGTTFKIYLPAARRRPTLISQDSGETNRRGSETVLLVEDEDALRHLGAVVLEDYGYTVLTATNAKQAMRLASRRKLKIHLLLTDVAMPGINGCELASTLRRQQPDLKVLFLSGYTEDAVRRRGTLDGDAAFLNKPFTPASLAAKVRRILDDKRANVPTSSGAS